MERSVHFRTLLESPAFGAYRAEFIRWLESGTDDSALHHAGVELCRVVRVSPLQPEHLLVAFHALAFERPDAVSAKQLAVRANRYIGAVKLFMQACFGIDPPMRVVRGSDERVWTVMGIHEGARWDPEIEMRRRDWLCCVSSGDRRYISPVPRDWEQWTDSEIASAITQARPDLRGP